MARPIRIEPEAQAELDEAAVWYEAQRSGLGVEFLDAAEAAIRRLTSTPHTATPVPDVPPDLPVRRLFVQRFPYSVVFLDLPDQIRILAFAHARRRPGYWQGRCQSPPE